MDKTILSISLLFLTWNRLEFTKLSLESLLNRTNWSLVETFHIYDDTSTDGTWEYLNSIKLPPQTVLKQHKEHQVVKLMYKFIPQVHTKYIVKIDNDIILKENWLDILYKVIDDSPKLGFLGTEKNRDGELIKAGGYGYFKTRWIGGIGIMRREVFSIPLPMSYIRDKYFGFTQFQIRDCRDWDKGWVSPCLIEEDMARGGQRKELVEKYLKLGWQRNETA